jgi:hypothetical protein
MLTTTRLPLLLILAYSSLSPAVSLASTTAFSILLLQDTGKEIVLSFRSVETAVFLYLTNFCRSAERSTGGSLEYKLSVC